MTAPEWRDCADPDELAAAVAAGVEVLRTGDGEPTASRTAEQFRDNITTGVRYRVPTSWTWSPEPPAPDELRDTDPGLIRQLHDMADRWGARGVMETGATLWPDALPPTTTPLDGCEAVRLLDLAWGVIANADGWGDDTTWRQAAERWRDDYHQLLDSLRTPAPRPAGADPGAGGGCDGTSNGPTRKEAAMNETKTEWRDCADPDELAAAVAAGVEVQVTDQYGNTGPTCRRTASAFLDAIRDGFTYQLPTAWTWRTEPPAPDELRERLRLGIEDAVNDYADVVMDIMDAEVVRHAGWLAARLEEADAERTTLRHRLAETPPATADPWSKEALSLLPVPPWPGAVLSGLCDEDGQPTWLALAPNVLGEDVRTCVDFPWFICGSDNAVTPYWVEVRAPRAVPEPETERVPVLDAIRDRIELTHPEGEFLAVGVELREDGDLVAIEQQEPWGKAQPVAPDGTVEVLRDGGR